MDNTLTLSIIIVSFNTRDILRDCLHSIRSAGLRFGYEIVLVDNDSADGSVEMVREEFPEIRVIANRENRFFAKANNQGAAVANGRYLLLLNSDTLVEKGNIEKLVSFFDASPGRIACAGPTVLNPDRTLQSEGYALPSVSERLTMVWHLHRLLPRPLGRLLLPAGTPGLHRGNHRSGWVSGCCMMIRRDVYRQLGGLNEALEFYGEEPEFCFRLNRSGYETWVVQDATIVHLGGQSVGTDQAVFLKDRERAVKRYVALQKYTVGYARALLMSRVVLFSARFKYLFVPAAKKRLLAAGIAQEKTVIGELRKAIREA